MFTDPRTTDPKNLASLAEFMAEYDKRDTPRDGDWVRHPCGRMSRITHIWPDSVQIGGSASGQYHLNKYGISYSGALDSSIPTSGLRLTSETKNGMVWIWNRGYVGAGEGVDFVVPFRVYETDEPAFRPSGSSIGL